MVQLSVTSDPDFKVTTFLKSNISKWCILGTKLLKKTNRKPYTIYGMISLSMTLSDLCPLFQGHDISWSRRQSYYCTYGMVLCLYLDWPLNASRRFVSISWAVRDVVSAVIATATCLAGCWVAGWLSHSGIVSELLNLSENFFDHLKAPSF